MSTRRSTRSRSLAKTISQPAEGEDATEAAPATPRFVERVLPVQKTIYRVEGSSEAKEGSQRYPPIKTPPVGKGKKVSDGETSGKNIVLKVILNGHAAGELEVVTNVMYLDPKTLQDHSIYGERKETPAKWNKKEQHFEYSLAGRHRYNYLCLMKPERDVRKTPLEGRCRFALDITLRKKQDADDRRSPIVYDTIRSTIFDTTASKKKSDDEKREADGTFHLPHVGPEMPPPAAAPLALMPPASGDDGRPSSRSSSDTCDVGPVSAARPPRKGAAAASRTGGGPRQKNPPSDTIVVPPTTNLLSELFAHASGDAVPPADDDDRRSTLTCLDWEKEGIADPFIDEHGTLFVDPSEADRASQRGGDPIGSDVSQMSSLPASVLGSPLWNEADGPSLLADEPPLSQTESEVARAALPTALPAAAPPSAPPAGVPPAAGPPVAFEAPCPEPCAVAEPQLEPHVLVTEACQYATRELGNEDGAQLIELTAQVAKVANPLDMMRLFVNYTQKVRDNALKRGLGGLLLEALNGAPECANEAAHVKPEVSDEAARVKPEPIVKPEPSSARKRRKRR